MLERYLYVIRGDALYSLFLGGDLRGKLFD